MGFPSSGPRRPDVPAPAALEADDGCAPSAGLGDARAYGLEAVQEAGHVILAVVVKVPGAVCGGELFPGVSFELPGGQDDVAAVRDTGGELGGDPAGLLGFVEVQRHRHHQAHRLAEVQGPPDAPVVKDLVRVADVSRDGQDALSLGQDVLDVGQDQFVVVDVGDCRVRLDVPGGLVRVRGGGQPAAEVDELADASARDVGDGAALELPAFAGQFRGAREDPEKLLRLFPVGGKIVFAAEQVVVYPGNARLRCRDERLDGGLQFRAEPFGGFGLSESRLDSGFGGVCEVEELAADCLHRDLIAGEVEPEHVQRGPYRQRVITHHHPPTGISGLRR